MKVKISVTVDIDPDKWAFVFGIEKNEVRYDVCKYFSSLCEEQVERIEMQNQQHRVPSAGADCCENKSKGRNGLAKS